MLESNWKCKRTKVYKNKENGLAIGYLEHLKRDAKLRPWMTLKYLKYFFPNVDPKFVLTYFVRVFLGPIPS